MLFIDYHNFIHENKDFEPYKMLTAAEVEAFLEGNKFKVEYEQYESICYEVYQYFMKNNYQVSSIACVLVNGLSSGDLSLKDLGTTKVKCYLDENVPYAN